MPTRREVLCAKSFDRYLAHQLDSPMPCWKVVPQGEDPPDFFLTLDKEIYAVEITSTTVFRKPAIGNVPVREETYEDTHRELVRSINAAARAKGLKGRYVVTFNQPVGSIDANFPRVQKELMRNLLDAIFRSQEEPVTWSESIKYEENERCYLYKAGVGEIRFLKCLILIL